MSEITPPEQIEVANTPVAPTPAQAAHARLVEEYELPDSSAPPLVYETSTPAVAPVVPAAPVVPDPPKHSQRVLRMAQDFGIPQAEIDQADPEQLDYAVYQLHRSRFQEVATRQPAAPTAPTVPVAPPAPEPEFTLGIDPELWDRLDDSLKTAFKTITTELRELRGLRSLRDEVGGLKQHVQNQQAEAMDARMDRSFARHKAHLGDGSRQEIDPASPEYQRRVAVLSVAQRDTRPGSLEQKIDRAVIALYGSAPPSVTPPVAPVVPAPSTLTRDVNGRITGRITPEEWNAAAVAKPSHREGAKEPLGIKRAEKAVANHLKELELSDQANGTVYDPEADLPE